jgi:NADH-quinone oxidoreductase subunit L
VQNDIKRVIAYSTCSQLGYMFVALGVGAYSIGVFHLFTHAFFKALLFLGAGSVIHAMHHEQDIRNMGSLRRYIPFTAAMMAIGTLALTGFPFTAGYYSKDAIIEAAYVSQRPGANLAFLATVIAAFMTSFYSWRLFFLTFEGLKRWGGTMRTTTPRRPRGRGARRAQPRRGAGLPCGPRARPPRGAQPA